MKDTLLHLTLREMQALLFSPRFWGVILVVSLVLGITGPFGTYEQLDLMPRLAYWLALALATFAVGYLSIKLTLGALLGAKGTRPLRSAIAGIAAGVPVALVVLAFNLALFGGPVPHAADIAMLFINCSLIAAAISFLSTLASSGPSREATPGAAPPLAQTDEEQATADHVSPAPSQAMRPPLIDRLPHAARGKLAYLSMQDHYVEVHTDKGTTLILMRLADAIREAGEVAGLQIHRSHWVALDVVTGSRRKDGKLFLKLADDALLPVSRSHADAVRRAGLV
ncbi:LytTR family transcriptional regulator DNA-binding domain-containing protein [Mesorhizobium sp. AR10]|uniref:LytTR family DNA-binding domain-containing protein n=1 Tax=Mesorhizobium sp. AR10 TaxID=2865839 RepID=UPI00215F951A|nr:LytTR family DNA-binding domain-containing protein [Mesorhizobium sp. AR10]UVK39573.1 LytTR family transcriptional regulator DNA-binding domain-containing protein [Mesorhizobium sp. AR10]